MANARASTSVRRKQIIDAARKLIMKYGSEHVTVKRIAEEIGTTEGAIYRHFKSKRDILSLLIEHIEENLIGDIQKSRSSARSALEILDMVMRSHVSSIERRKGVSFQVIAEIISLGDKKLNAKIHGVLGRYTTGIRELLSQGVEAGEIRADVDLDAASVLFFGMIQGLVTLWALEGFKPKLAQRYLPVWSIFRDAVAKPASPGPGLR